jgi:HSP20 family molecular chaperone IbpA
VILQAKSAKSRSQDVKIAAMRPESAARERCIGFSSLAELIEDEDRIEIIAAVPGFDAAHLAVDVLADAIVIEGDRDAGRKLLCRLHLPCAVQARNAAARLEHGRLTVTAPKQGPAGIAP